MKTLLALFAAFAMATPALAADPPAKKWHPGYYFEATPADGHLTDTQWQARIVATGMQGALARFKWRELETARGVYNFAAIRALLDRAVRDGKFIGLHVEDLNWGDTKDPGKCVPDYLMTAELGGGQMTRPKPSGGVWCSAARWNPAVMDRYIALMTALSIAFDNHPAFVWVQTTESATSMGTQLSAAQRTTLAQQYLRLADAMGATWTRTVWAMSVNWETGDLRSLVERIRLAGGGLTWPDTLPANCANCHKTPLYALLPDYVGQMPIGPTIEMTFLTGSDHPLRDGWDCGGHPCTWADVHRQTLAWGGHYIQWQPTGWGETAATNFNFERDLVPLLTAAKWEATTTCPANIRCEGAGQSVELDTLRAAITELRSQLTGSITNIETRTTAVETGSRTAVEAERARIDELLLKMDAASTALRR